MRCVVHEKQDLGLLDMGVADSTDKYNHLPPALTGESPHEAWFNTNNPHLSNLYVF